MVTSARFLYWPRASFVWLLAPFLLHHLLLLLLAHCFPPLALAPHLGSNPSRPWGRLVPIAPEDSVKVVKNRRLTMLIRSFTPKNHHFRCGSGVERRQGRPKERGETGRGSAAGGQERRAGELRVQLEGRRDGRKGQGGAAGGEEEWERWAGGVGVRWRGGDTGGRGKVSGRGRRQRDLGQVRRLRGNRRTALASRAR